MPEDLQTPDHVVALAVVCWQRLSFFRATTLPPWSTTGHVLSAFDLLPWCGPMQEHCMVTHNGHQWPPSLRRNINHGDYILISPRTLPFPGFAEHLANIFNREDELYPWQNIDAIAAARLTGSSSQASTLSPGPFPTPRLHHMADWYWITMAWIMSFGAFAMLRCLCPKEKALPMHSRIVQGRRYKQATQSFPHGQGPRAFAMMFLIMSQHVIETEAIQIAFLSGQTAQDSHHDESPALLPFADKRYGWSEHEAPCIWSEFDRLPPPGNPFLDDEWPSLRDSLTEQGRLLCAFLDMRCGFAISRTYIGAEPCCSPTTGLSGRVGADRDYHNKRPIPTPARAALHSCPDQPPHPGKVLLPQDVNACPTDASKPLDPETRTTTCPLFCTDRDLDDLMATWLETDPPLFEDVANVPALLQAILTRPYLDISHATKLAIYTDGSKGTEQISDNLPSTTWTFVVLGYSQDLWHIVTWYGDFLELDPLDLKWCGALHDTVLEGETCALLGAYLWILQAETTQDVPIFSDSLLALNMSSGRYAYRLDDDMMMRARAVYHFLQVCSYRTGRYHVSHIKAHQGHLGNELADYVAGAIRVGRLGRRPLPRHFAAWFHGSPPKILQAGFTMDFVIRPAELPRIQLDSILFPPADIPTQAPDWLPQTKPGHKTATTKIPSMTFVTYNVHTLKKQGASAFLRSQFETKKVFMAGLQETRTSFDSTFDSTYLRFCAPADKGQGGTELWIARGVPFAFVDGEPCFLRRQDVQVIYADPECLLAEITLGNLSFLSCVAHGPHKGYSPAQIHDWWSNFTARIVASRKDRHMLCFVDANANVGEAEPYFGSEAAQEWDEAGRGLLDFCQTLGLFAPSTWSTLHSGPSNTWTSAKAATHGSRNDYILVDMRWRNQCNGSWIDSFFDAGHQMIDHSAAVVSLRLSMEIQDLPLRKTLYDRQKILAATHDDWQRFYADWPTIPWEVDVTEHARQVETFLQERLTTFFPKDKASVRNSVFGDGTWQIYHQKMKAKKQLTACKITHDHWLQAMGWACWTGTPHHCCRVQCLLLILRTCGRLNRYRSLGHELHGRLLQDRADYVDKLMDPLQQSPGKAAVRLLRPLRLGKRYRHMGKKSLPMVKMEDGEIAMSRSEATSRWRRHFGDIEGGLLTTSDQLWHDHMARHAQKEAQSIGEADIPTAFELEAALRHAASNKACGPDGIPGELLHASCSHLSHHLWPLLFKMTVRVQEPLQYKGGNLIALFKRKGSPLECASYRAILVSSPLGKSLHNVYRSRLIPHLQKAATPLQFSAQSGAMVAMAAHTIRLAQGRAKRSGFSDYVLFLDIASAYYTLLRQHAVDLSHGDEDVIKFLHRMGIADAHIDTVAEMIQSTPAITDLGVSPHLHSMISEFHQSTWFALPHDEAITATSRGTRPGDGLADVLWAMTFNRYLRTVEAQLHASGALRPAQWNQEIGLLTAPGPHETIGACVTWADDLACFGFTAAATDLIPSASTAAQIIFEGLNRLGLQPNMGKGKTEFIATPRGPGRTGVRQYLHHACGSMISFTPELSSEVGVRVVAHYPHLGGQLSHCGRMRGEVKRRLAIAAQSMAELGPKVYRNKKVDLPTRLAIFQSTTWPALLYNAGTWPPLTPFETRCWHSGVMRLYRRLLCKIFPFETAFKSPDAKIIAITGLPDPRTALRMARLRYFGQALGRGCGVLWALAAEEHTWISQVREDFNWLYSQLCGLTSMPDPEEDPASWHQLILQSHPKWKGLLKRAEAHCSLQWKLRYEVDVFHYQLVEILKLQGLCGPSSHPDEPADRAQAEHRCLICQRTFASRRAWGSHCFKAHGRVNPCRSLTEGTTCGACGKEYPSHERLIRHLRTTPSCQSTMAGQRLWTQPQPYYGSKVVQEREPLDSMLPWKRTPLLRLPHRNAQPLTTASFQALRWTSLCDWRTITDEEITHLVQRLSTVPIHWNELTEILTAQRAFFSHDRADHHLDKLEAILHRAFFPTERTTPTAISRDNWHLCMDLLDFKPAMPAPRKAPRMLYVLHLFSGVKRPKDIHSYIAALPTPSSGILCPISIDYVLDPKTCDILQDDVQRFWLEKARDGYLFMVIAGPPCETWSVSRLRYLLTGSGPRPVRSSCNDNLLWGKEVLRLRELRQVTVGNRLLQFCLLVAAMQAITNNFAIIEHPMKSGFKHNCWPVSIWRLAATRLLLRHPNITAFDIWQGLYGGISPKPTTLMVVAPASLWPSISTILDHGRTKLVPPKPIQMGRSSHLPGYNTAPLKRYPPSLCKTLAKVTFMLSDYAAKTSHNDDGIIDIAFSLEKLYQEVVEGTVDGADFHGSAGPT